MSDSLKDRLASHSGSFEGLLSLIPAKYYYEDDAKTQLKDAGEKGAKTQDSGRAKRGKLDQEAGSSALDEMKRREGSTLDSDDNDDDDVPIYDDHGNQISGPRELSIQELLRSKAGSEAPQDDGEQKGPEQAQRPTERMDHSAIAKRGNVKNKKADSDKNGSEDLGDSARNGAASNGEAGTAQSIVGPHGADISASIDDSIDGESKVENGQVKQQTPSDNKKGVYELREKLAARISEMRAKRKAPGSSAPGAPKNREELLALRKQRQEQKQKAQSLKRKRNENDSDNEGQGDEMDDVVSEEPGSQNIMFGQVQFKDGGRLGRDLAHIDEKKRVKKRNAIDQLRVIENRKAKLEQLEEDKRKEVAENAKWSRAILQSEGAKIRDDEKLLRKTLRTKERQKSKSAKAWRDRKETVRNDIAAREAKRTANIKAHREAKQLRLKGKKRKDHMKRAGFEGKHR